MNVLTNAAQEIYLLHAYSPNFSLSYCFIEGKCKWLLIKLYMHKLDYVHHQIIMIHELTYTLLQKQNVSTYNMIFLKNAKKVVGVRKPCNSCVYVLSVHV